MPMQERQKGVISSPYRKTQGGEEPSPVSRKEKKKKGKGERDILRKNEEKEREDFTIRVVEVGFRLRKGIWSKKKKEQRGTFTTVM